MILSCWLMHWQQGDGAIRRREDARRSSTVLKPTKTLFVVNFDPINTRAHDLERHFEPYGKLLRVQIRKNFGFVQYGSQDEATKALECTNMRWLFICLLFIEARHCHLTFSYHILYQIWLEGMIDLWCGTILCLICFLFFFSQQFSCL